MNNLPTVIVIGSNSFSGSNFVDLLLEKAKYYVVGISRSPEKSLAFLPYKNRTNNNFKFYQLNMNLECDKIVELCDRLKPEFIVNFAAQSEVAPSWENPSHWFQTNVVSLAGLAHRLKQKKYLKKFVQISSPEVYGSCEGLVKEDAPLNPSTPYAASKAAGDLALATYVKNYDFPLVTIRATNVYGAHQQLFKIIPRTVIYLRQGKKIQLHGGGKAIKSYIHIKDVSLGELAAMEHGDVGKIYHFSPDSGVAVAEVVELICNKLGKSYDESTEVVEERLGQDAAYVIDSTLARGKFSWKPTINLEKGIEQVVSWIDLHWSEISQLPLSYQHKE